MEYVKKGFRKTITAKRVQRFVAILVAISLTAGLYYSRYSSPLKTHAATKVLLVTAGGGTWTVPADWNSSSNTIECLGAGGNGGSGGVSNNSADGGGGGGGSYTKVTNLSLTAGNSISYQVGSPNSSTVRGTSASPGTADTWFSSATSVLYCQGGSAGTSNAVSAVAGDPGRATNDVPAAAGFDGGSGSAGSSLGAGGGGGGGGGPSGIGKAGGTVTGGGGAGGGGSNGGASTAGTGTSAANGGAGGAGTGGTGGGTAGITTACAAPGNGSSGGGGGGGAGSTCGSSGAAGGTDTAWDSTHGASGGGGGGGRITSAGAGGSGGASSYGGGGGGGGGSIAAVSAPAGAGGQGILVITYTPTVDTTPPSPDPASFASSPAAVSASSVSMTATTETDASSPPVQYYFGYTVSTCGANAGTGGADSGWQSGTSYTNSSLQPNQCYGYTVRARDNATTPNMTASSSASITYTNANVPGTPTLSSPTNTTLTLTNNANGNPSSNPTTNFAVQITATSPTDATWQAKYVNASGNPSSSVVWLTNAQLTNLVLNSLTSGTTYTAQSMAQNQNSIVTASSTASTGTTTIAPGTPGTPTFSNIAGTSVTVSWTAATGATTYSLESCSGSGCSSFTQIATGLTGTSYNDSGLITTTSYSYRVIATNSGGNGPYSGTGQTTTLSDPAAGSAAVARLKGNVRLKGGDRLR